jgi:ABC-type Mn2+/Zn2+ transport system ATPase subunit
LGHHYDCVAFIPQREEVDWMFPVTVKDVVEMGRFKETSIIKRLTKQDKEIVLEAMLQMDILEHANRSIDNLSGGQQQRVFIARALAQKPHVLLMDEPFNGVDVLTQEIVWNLLDKIRERKVTVMIATHDLNIASLKFDSVILINKKLIVAGPPSKVFTIPNLQKAFGNQIIFVGNNAIVDQCCQREPK